MLEKIPQLTGDFFLGNFIGGLKDETKKIVKLLDPDTLSKAYKQAKFYEVPSPKLAYSYTKPTPYPKPN